jgi:hypothetical protein
MEIGHGTLLTCPPTQGAFRLDAACSERPRCQHAFPKFRESCPALFCEIPSVYFMCGVATCSRRKSDRSNGNFGAFEWDGSRRESAPFTPEQVGVVAENSENCCLRLKGDDHLRPQPPMEFQKRLPIRSLLKSSGMPVQRPFAIPSKVVAWRSTSRWARPTRRKVRPAEFREYLSSQDSGLLADNPAVVRGSRLQATNRRNSENHRTPPISAEPPIASRHGIGNSEIVGPHVMGRIETLIPRGHW